MRFKNKNGIGMDNAAPILIMMVIGVIIFFGFQLVKYAKSSGSVSELQMQKDVVEGQRLLLEYFTSTDKSGMSKSDMLRTAYSDKDFRLIEDDASGFFSSRLGHLAGWQVSIVDSSGDSLHSFEGGLTGFDIAPNKYPAGSLLIPSSENYLIVRLSFGRGVKSIFGRGDVY